MRCDRHKYEYDFGIGVCPHCEDESRARVALELAEKAASQRKLQLELDREAIEQSQQQHEEMQAALESQLDSIRELEEDRRLRLEELEEDKRLHLEELEEKRRQNLETTLEQARLAKIAHDVEVLCRSAQRKLDAGRANEALEDAERALDEDPNDASALELAYFAAKTANRGVAVLEAYLERWAHIYISSTLSSSDLLIEEAAGLAAEHLVRKFVDRYRKTPANLRDTLDKIGRLELLSPWLEVRLKRFLVEKVGFSVESLLDAIVALADGPVRISMWSEHLVEFLAFYAPVALWLKARGFEKGASGYVRSCVTGPHAPTGFTKVFAEWLISNGYLSEASTYVRSYVTGPQAPAGFRKEFAEWLISIGYLSDASTYIRSCATGPLSNAGFRKEFAEWLITHGYLTDASKYLHDRVAECDVQTRVFTVIPLGLETSRRLQAPTSDWISMLNADLATLPISKLSGITLQSNLLSTETKDDVTKSLICHLKHVIKGPSAYRRGAGLQDPKAGDEKVFSIKTGQLINRPLLYLNVPLIGVGGGLVVWLLPGGDFNSATTRASPNSQVRVTFFFSPVLTIPSVISSSADAVRRSEHLTTPRQDMLPVGSEATLLRFRPYRPKAIDSSRRPPGRQQGANRVFPCDLPELVCSVHGLISIRLLFHRVR